MRRLRHRLINAPELLDAVEHDRSELEQSLDQVAEVNRLLGGRRAVLLALAPLLDRRRTTRILDVGTGSADIPLAIARFSGRSGHRVEVIATDVHPQMLEIAAERAAGTGIVISAADACALPCDRDAVDIVILSLTLHHFERGDQLRALAEAARVARRAVIVNELERSRWNYLGARLLAITHWRGNRLTRHDGPLSVLRAFTRGELIALADSAGLKMERLDRRFFGRLVLVADCRDQHRSTG